MKVQDIDGKEIQGLFRNLDGSLLVKYDPSYIKYQSQVRDKERLNNLETELSEIKQLLKQLLSK